jgi:hypothetical protein
MAGLGFGSSAAPKTSLNPRPVQSVNPGTLAWLQRLVCPCAGNRCFGASACRSGLGVQAAAGKLLEVLGLTWAGSQVTKLARGAAALALAPVVDKLLVFLQGLSVGRSGCYTSVHPPIHPPSRALPA